jgi:hypothetical protein
MKRLLFFVILISPIWVYGQTPTPGQTLRLARATYEQGRLHEIEAQLTSDVIAKMTKAEKVEAYKILCLSNIYLEEPAKADESMLNILRTDPYFLINEAVDPAEFVALYKTFRTLPIFRIGGKLGVDACRPNVVEAATAGELAEGSEYSALIGIHFGASADIPLNRRLTLHGELLYTQKRFKLNQVFDRQTDVITGEELYNETEAIEQETWLSLPLMLEWKPLKKDSKFNKKINPYISGGVAIDYLLGAKITAEQLRDQETAIQEKTYDITRNSLNISAVGAIGSKIRVGGGYIVTELRYLYGITKVNSKENAYENQEITWEINYADPVFKLSSLELSVAYVQNIFKPKKLRRRK